MSFDTSVPVISDTVSLKIFTHAFMSFVQLLQCTMATGLPVGVVTISISGYTLLSGFSRTIIEKTEVPAETFPVPAATAFVAVIPVPASPSGGAKGIPADSFPPRSSDPFSVSLPASFPAVSTEGRRSLILPLKFISDNRLSNLSSILSS